MELGLYTRTLSFDVVAVPEGDPAPSPDAVKLLNDPSSRKDIYAANFSYAMTPS